MAGFTNKGKAMILGNIFNAVTTDMGTLHMTLVSTLPTQDTNILSDAIEVLGGGWTPGGGGASPAGLLALNATDFPSLLEDDSADIGSVLIRAFSWAAVGTSIAGIRAAVLTDNNASVPSRRIIAYWDLGGPTSISAGNTVGLSGLELRLTE